MKKLCSPSRLYIQLNGGAPYKTYFLYGCFGNCRCYSRRLRECPFLYLGSSQTKKVILYNWIYCATLRMLSIPFCKFEHNTHFCFFQEKGSKRTIFAKFPRVREKGNFCKASSLVTSLTLRVVFVTFVVLSVLLFPSPWPSSLADFIPFVKGLPAKTLTNEIVKK